MTTATVLDPLRIRKVLGRHAWTPPARFGPAGWLLDNPTAALRAIVTMHPLEVRAPGQVVDATEWIHASMSGADRVPTYYELCDLKTAVWGDDGEAYQVHPPAARHINIHPHALHLWGRADGCRVLPDFGAHGTI